MNTIQAIVGETAFVSERHLLFEIDGVSLDTILDSAHPDKGFSGLVPTTLNWLEVAAEQEEVWRRFCDRDASHSIIPLLCCPDDLDFSCSIIVVDAEFTDALVTWKRFGVDATPAERLPASIGSVTHWLSNVGPFSFHRDQYEQLVQAFEKHRWSQDSER